VHHLEKTFEVKVDEFATLCLFDCGSQLFLKLVEGIAKPVENHIVPHQNVRIPLQEAVGGVQSPMLFRGELGCSVWLDHMWILAGWIGNST